MAPRSRFLLMVGALLALTAGCNSSGSSDSAGGLSREPKPGDKPTAQQIEQMRRARMPQGTRR
jgi:hypothetical protein